jgi:hypothetical protein
MFTVKGVPILVVIVAELRALADWLSSEGQRISSLNGVGLALNCT